MRTTPAGWTVLHDDPPLFLRHYPMGPGDVTTTLVIGTERGLLVMSPGIETPDDALAELAAHGDVVALLAPNHFHTLGIAPWKAAFPAAAVVAGAPGCARVAAKSGLAAVPLAEWLDGDDLGLVEPPATKNGEIWWHRGEAVYCGDAYLNVAELPWFPKGWALRAMGFGTGLRHNALRATTMLADKDAYARWLDGLLSASPTRLIPGHGDVLDAPDLVARIRALHA